MHVDDCASGFNGPKIMGYRTLQVGGANPPSRFDASSSILKRNIPTFTNLSAVPEHNPRRELATTKLRMKNEERGPRAFRVFHSAFSILNSSFKPWLSTT